MNNKFTTTTIARGCEWCQTCLESPWSNWWGSTSECIDPNRATELCSSKQQTLFHGACARLGRHDIHWMPSTSEVIGYAECSPVDRSKCYAGRDGGEPLLKLDELRVHVEEWLYEQMQDVSVNVIEQEAELSNFLDSFDADDLGDLSQFVQ